MRDFVGRPLYARKLTSCILDIQEKNKKRDGVGDI